MGGQICTYIDVDDVIDELSDDDLLDEVKSRGLSVGGIAPKGSDLSDALLEDIEEAARSGRAWDLLRLVQQSLLPATSPCKATPYASLERDPVSGRPVIQ